MVEIIVAANLVAIKVVIDTVTIVIIVAMDVVVTEALETVEATVDMEASAGCGGGWTWWIIILLFFFGGCW